MSLRINPSIKLMNDIREQLNWGTLDEKKIRDALQGDLKLICNKLPQINEKEVIVEGIKLFDDMNKKIKDYKRISRYNTELLKDNRVRFIELKEDGSKEVVSNFFNVTDEKILTSGLIKLHKEVTNTLKVKLKEYKSLNQYLNDYLKTK